MPRPIKKPEERRIQKMLSCSSHFLNFADEHKGKMCFSEWIECMSYEGAGSSTKWDKLTSDLREAKQEINELKRQLMFERSKNKKQNLPEITVFEDRDLIKWYNEKGMAEVLRTAREVNWQNLFDKNMAFLSLKLKDAKTLKDFCMERYRNNGGAKP